MFSRKTQRVAIVQSDSAVISPPLRAIEIFTTGDVSVRELSTGATITMTFPAAAAGGAYPYVWEINCDMVFATATTVADAALLGFRS